MLLILLLSKNYQIILKEKSQPEIDLFPKASWDIKLCPEWKSLVKKLYNLFLAEIAPSYLFLALCSQLTWPGQSYYIGQWWRYRIILYFPEKFKWTFFLSTSSRTPGKPWKTSMNRTYDFVKRMMNECKWDFHKSEMKAFRIWWLDWLPPPLVR